MKLTSADQLQRRLGESPAGAYLISSDEPLIAGEAADLVRQAARKAGFTEREVFFIERSSPWAEILTSAQSLSLFSPRKLLEIRMPGGKPGTGAAVLGEVLRLAGADLIVLILTERLDGQAQKAEWVEVVSRLGTWLEPVPVTPERFPGWLRERAQRLGLKLDDAGVQALAAHTEGNLLAAHQELQKLALAGLSEAGELEVLASVSASSHFDVFQLGGALLAGDAARALSILASLRGEGIEPTLVLWAILQEMRNLWLKMVPGGPLPGVWSSNQAQVPRAMGRARAGAGPRALFMRLAERAARADRMIKGRLQGNPWDELNQLALDFAGRRTLPLVKL